LSKNIFLFIFDHQFRKEYGGFILNASLKEIEIKLIGYKSISPLLKGKKDF